MYVVCPEHLDQAIDEFVEVYEMPPDLYLLDKVSFTDWTAPQHCDFCQRAPVYLVV
ncbi:MAG: CxxH/CxxC protein [Firmicutes bacterium]|nr:CxxH/CxxC protein [Bacillota bacterium]HOB34920.1 CxxH/CxxC protein [Bacillota bacterium]HPZ91258.1 CxxH/CxxC protein [Bacillota bacterium]HQE02031.1 CxxH/CxxC protein [Bacillota bacterium]